jgi:hypothetical protein
MGLEVLLDAHSNVVEALSISRDFEGLTGLITDSESFPLMVQGGMEIRPGIDFAKLHFGRKVFGQIFFPIIIFLDEYVSTQK